MKQENVFKIGIIVVAVLATSGVVGFLLTQRAVEKVATVEKSVAPVARKTLPTKNALLQDAISGIDNKVTLNLPIGWGELVVPSLESGAVSDKIYGTKEYSALFLPGEKKDARMISDYNYGNRAEHRVAPYIEITYYPAKFSNDDPNSDIIKQHTAKEKEANFQPIADIFKKGNLDGMDLSQQCFAVKKPTAEYDKCMQSTYYGFWWANEWAGYDRIAVRYFQNSTGDLRGIGYFEVSGQETPDTIAGYHVVLFNLEKRMTVEIFLPLEGVYSFGLSGIPYDEKLSGKKNDEVYMTEAPKLIQKAYAYLENPENYKDQKLGQFLREVEAMVSSVKIVAQ